MSDPRLLNRRQFNRAIAAAAAVGATWRRAAAAEPAAFRLRYIVGSSMYGTTPLAEILPELAKCGADSIDIWPRVHGNQREQVEAMGHPRFAELLKQNNARLGISTRYDLGPFDLRDEIEFVHKLGGRMIVTGSRGPVGLRGKALRTAVAEFVEKMKPTLELAERRQVSIAIENHGRALIDSPESLRYLAELSPSDRFGVALAPYHLPQDEKQLARLIADLGPSLLHFYAWQHGDGCHEKLPKERELLQMPGRGPLDFAPLLAGLKKINYSGWTEIFMHPVPRGIPILKSTSAVTAEINRARRYLAAWLSSCERALSAGRKSASVPAPINGDLYNSSRGYAPGAESFAMRGRSSRMTFTGKGWADARNSSKTSSKSRGASGPT
jgi:sugar phosphate isomerase/epimerase